MKKPKFVSPFQRYKCVIPMIVEMEAREREKQQKEEEEEKHLAGIVTDLNVDQVEIDESKARVHEHFKQVSQSSSQTVQSTSKKNKKKRKRNSEVVLGQMHGKKRKKESNIAKESASQERSDNNFCTPTPSLNTRIMHIPRKMRQKMQSAIEEQRVQKTFAQVQSHNNTKIVSIR